MTAPWIDPRAPRRPLLTTPEHAHRLFWRRLAAIAREAAEIIATASIVAGLLAMLEAIIH